MSNVSTMLKIAYNGMMIKLKRNTIQPVVNKLNDDLFEGNEYIKTAKHLFDYMETTYAYENVFMLSPLNVTFLRECLVSTEFEVTILLEIIDTYIENKLIPFQMKETSSASSVKRTSNHTSLSRGVARPSGTKEDWFHTYQNNGMQISELMFSTLDEIMLKMPSLVGSITSATIKSNPPLRQISALMSHLNQGEEYWMEFFSAIENYSALKEFWYIEPARRTTSTYDDDALVSVLFRNKDRTFKRNATRRIVNAGIEVTLEEDAWNMSAADVSKLRVYLQNENLKPYVHVVYILEEYDPSIKEVLYCSEDHFRKFVDPKIRGKLQSKWRNIAFAIGLDPKTYDGVAACDAFSYLVGDCLHNAQLRAEFTRFALRECPSIYTNIFRCTSY